MKNNLFQNIFINLSANKTWKFRDPGFGKVEQLLLLLCQLFANGSELSSYSLIDSVNNWKGLSKRINQHESSVLHKK